MKTTVLKCSVPSHGNDVFKNKFHKGIDFSLGIDSVESMPGVLESFKIRAQVFLIVVTDL
jgi:hypothetical protein